MRLAILALSTLAAACGGPTVGDLVSQEIVITVRAVSSAPDEVALVKPDGGAALTRAFFSSSALTLSACNEDVAPIELGPRGYELVSNSPYQERISTAVSNFCSVQLDIEPVDENESEGVPQGASVYVEGTDANGEPFTLSSSASLSLRLETDADPGLGKVPLLLGIDAAVWLKGLPLPEEMSDMAAQMFEEQLTEATALYVDEDEDGALGDGESKPLLHASQ
jgi:hypothetical protein